MKNLTDTSKDENTSKKSNPESTDSNASDSGIDEDDEYHDSVESIGSVIETPPHKKESEGPFSEVTNDIIVAYQSERNNTWDTPPVMHIGLREPINLTGRIAAPATSLDSPGGGEYWDPVSDTYRSKMTNNRVPDEIIQEENTPEGYKTDSSVEIGSALSINSDLWEYWDPISDSYKSKKPSRISQIKVNKEEVQSQVLTPVLEKIGIQQ